MTMKVTLTIDVESYLAAIEALRALEESPWCVKYKAARKDLRGAFLMVVGREIDADATPVFLRKQAG